MKKVLLIFTVVMTVQFAGCKGNDNNKKSKVAGPNEPVLAMNTETPKKDKEHKSTILLSKSDFLEKVWDYQKNPKEFIYKGDKPCLIDFYADWCAPCRMMAPVMEELAKEYEGKIYIYKIDTEAEKELAAVFGIQSLPSFIIIPKDSDPQMLPPGANRKEYYKGIIESELLKK